jgi:hypothetical protein
LGQRRLAGGPGGNLLFGGWRRGGGRCLCCRCGAGKIDCSAASRRLGQRELVLDPQQPAARVERKEKCNRPGEDKGKAKQSEKDEIHAVSRSSTGGVQGNRADGYCQATCFNPREGSQIKQSWPK